MSQILGTSGFVTVSMTNYNVSEWAITPVNDVQDISDVSSSWQQFLAGLNGADGTFKIFWGASSGVFTNVFAIGSTVSFTFAIGGSGLSFSCSALINNYTVTNNAKSPIEFTCTYKVTGTLTYPT